MLAFLRNSSILSSTHIQIPIPSKPHPDTWKNRTSVDCLLCSIILSSSINYFFQQYFSNHLKYLTFNFPIVIFRVFSLFLINFYIVFTIFTCISFLKVSQQQAQIVTNYIFFMYPKKYIKNLLESNHAFMIQEKRCILPQYYVNIMN